MNLVASSSKETAGKVFFYFGGGGVVEGAEKLVVFCGLLFYPTSCHKVILV